MGDAGETGEEVYWGDLGEKRWPRSPLFVGRLLVSTFYPLLCGIEMASTHSAEAEQTMTIQLYDLMFKGRS